MKDQEIYCYTLTAKTDIRTGSAAGRKDPFQNTGILGSIRWWFEILIRGLEGGSACDPNDSKTRCSGTSRCTVCELFGCTGWARKFRFEVLEEDKSAPRKTAIKKDDTFHLKFIPLRPIAQEEWDLLKAALWLIGEYGALGGKTGCINQPHGFVTHGTKSPQPRLNPNAIRQHLKRGKMVQNSPYSWAALDCFWSGTGYDLKGKMQQLKIHSELAKKREAEWLFGSQKMGKKIFHYHEDSASDPYSRSFGFVKTKDQLSTLEDALKSCKDPKRSADTTFIKGLKIREELMQGEGENR